MARTYGAVKDRYRPTDKIHPVLRLAKLADVVNNKGFIPPVVNQGTNSACVGESFSEQLSARAKKAGVYAESFSPKWVWSGARYVEACLPSNCGVQPGDAADWLKMKGCLLDHFWPLDPNTFDPSPPPSEDMPEAAKYPIADFFRITGDQDSICSAIMLYDFVSIGTPWFPQWDDIGSDGQLPTPQKGWYLPPNQWHETLIYGYDRNKGIYLGVNSWGEGYGDHGHFLMPFEAFDRFSDYGGWDAMYITIGNWPVEPPPPPSPCWLKQLFSLNNR